MKNVLSVIGCVAGIIFTIPAAIKFIFTAFLYMIDNPWQVVQVTGLIMFIWILFEQLRNAFDSMQYDDDSI